MRLIAIVVFIVSFQMARAQGLYHSNWHFGDSVAISFSGGAPINLPSCRLSTSEGCSSMSDSLGNLLLYSDGINVFNANHLLMPNGDSLHGCESSTQAALIVKHPSSDHLYYVFTTDCNENNGEYGLSYSVVDMALDGGLGDVVEKNTLLLAGCDEKLTATYNSTSTGYWIVTYLRDATTSAYYSYPFTNSGIGVPVISHVAPVDAISYRAGNLRISPDNRYIVSCHWVQSKMQVGSFNDTTGVISNDFQIDSIPYPYYAEFSGSGDRLYVTGNFVTLYQIDATSMDSVALNNSVQVIHNAQPMFGLLALGALQRAADGKIYVARNEKYFLGTIADPDELGTACNYIDNGVALNEFSMLGLPNFVYPVTAAPTSTASSHREAQQLFIFPSPTSHVVKCQLEEKIIAYKIVDAVGNCVVKGDTPVNNDVNVTHLPTGLYIFEVTTENRQYRNCFIKK